MLRGADGERSASPSEHQKSIGSSLGEKFPLSPTSPLAPPPSARSFPTFTSCVFTPKPTFTGNSAPDQMVTEATLSGGLGGWGGGVLFTIC